MTSPAADSDRILQLEADLREERAIVDRIWNMFGRPSYEELNGRTIYDLIADVQKRAAEMDKQP